MKLKSIFIDKTFYKFVLVGIVNTIFGTAIMFAFYNVFHLSYWMSSVANYLFGSILSYFLNKYFTFQYKKRSWNVVLKFIANISICYMFAYGCAKPLAMWILSYASKPIQENVAMLIGMVLFVIMNYIGQRFFAFKK